MSLNHTKLGAGIARLAGSCIVLFAASALAGEKMVESAPSKERPKLPSKSAPIDPILDRVLNPGGANSSFNPGGMPVVPIAPSTRPGIDPNLQRQLGLHIDKRRNWLLENAAKVDASGQIRDLEADPTPRFSQPTAILTAPGTGERYLRATENAKTDKPTQQNAPNPLPGSGDPDDPQNLSATEKESARAIPFRTMTGDGTSTRGTDPSQADRKGVFTDPGAFANTSRSALEEARKTAAEERSAIFDRLLSNNTQSPAAAQDAAALGGLGLNKTPQSRSQQFQSLLAAPTEPATSGGLLGNPMAAVTAPRASGLATAERPGASLAPAAVPVAPKPAPVRLEPRPALLQIPTRGF